MHISAVSSFVKLNNNSIEIIYHNLSNNIFLLFSKMYSILINTTLILSICTYDDFPVTHLMLVYLCFFLLFLILANNLFFGFLDFKNWSLICTLILLFFSFLIYCFLSLSHAFLTFIFLGCTIFCFSSLSFIHSFIQYHILMPLYVKCFWKLEIQHWTNRQKSLLSLSWHFSEIFLN